MLHPAMTAAQPSTETDRSVTRAQYGAVAPAPALMKFTFLAAKLTRANGRSFDVGELIKGLQIQQQWTMDISSRCSVRLCIQLLTRWL